MGSLLTSYQRSDAVQVDSKASANGARAAYVDATTAYLRYLEEREEKNLTLWQERIVSADEVDSYRFEVAMYRYNLAQVQGDQDEAKEQLSTHFSRAAVEQPFTLLYGIIGLGTGQVRFVSAGHPGPIYLPWDAPPLQLVVSGLPIGVEAGHYQEQVVQLQPTDRLVLYTDGVTETRNADGEHFGIQRFLAALDQSRGLLLDKSLENVVETMERWRGDVPPHGDISILCVERTNQAGLAFATASEPTQTRQQFSGPASQEPTRSKVP
jgi:hypothetical protein